jgi:hypothetical protein
MKSLVLSLVLTVIPVLADDGAASIGLYTSFQQAPPDAVRDFIRDEAARIMSPMGLAFKWIAMEDNKGNELSVKLAVVHFNGSCEAANLAVAQSTQSLALGWTYITDGTIQPFSDIDCDGIRAFLRTDLLAMPKEDREEAYGRAVGRVLAHELYHIFANTPHHGSHGVAKSYYSPQDLLSKDFQFEQKESEELRDSVTGGF